MSHITATATAIAPRSHKRQDDARERNLNRMDVYVRAQIGFAANREPDLADEYLMAHADRVQALMGQLGGANPHLDGLTAFDLANARDQLAAAAVAQRDRVA